MLTAVWRANNGQAWLMSVDRAVERSEQRSSHEGRGLVIGPWRVDSNSSALTSDCTTRDSSHHLLDHCPGHSHIWQSCHGAPAYNAYCESWIYHQFCERLQSYWGGKGRQPKSVERECCPPGGGRGCQSELTNAVVLEGTRWLTKTLQWRLAITIHIYSVRIDGRELDQTLRSWRVSLNLG